MPWFKFQPKCQKTSHPFFLESVSAYGSPAGTHHCHLTNPAQFTHVLLFHSSFFHEEITPLKTDLASVFHMYLTITGFYTTLVYL